MLPFQNWQIVDILRYLGVTARWKKNSINFCPGVYSSIRKKWLIKWKHHKKGLHKKTLAWYLLFSVGGVGAETKYNALLKIISQQKETLA